MNFKGIVSGGAYAGTWIDGKARALIAISRGLLSFIRFIQAGKKGAVITTTEYGAVITTTEYGAVITTTEYGAVITEDV